MNQRRRDDHKGDITQTYKAELAKASAGDSTLLYEDDLANRVKAINETNRVASCLAGTQQRAYPKWTRNQSTSAIRSWPTELDGAIPRLFFRAGAPTQ